MIFCYIKPMSDRIKNNMRDPRVWDKLKDQLDESDKQNFFNVYFVDSNDPIINCRKAELHIMIGSEEDDAAALKLLENNQELLALGLKAKLLGILEDQTGLENLLEQGFGVCKTEHDFEGAIHFERAKSAYFYKQGDFQESLKCEYRVDGLANYLQLSYLQKVAQHGINNALTRIGSSLPNQNLHTGNLQLKKSSQENHFASLLLKGQFEKIENSSFGHNFKVLAKAVQAKQVARYNYALLLLSKVSFRETEFQVHALLLKLELFGRTNDHEYTQPQACLQELIRLLPDLRFRLQVISDCAKLYPLGVVMAGLDAEIPIVKNKGYRDGIHYLGKVLVLPNTARRLLIQDDLENTQSLSLMSKAQRYRMNQKLRAENLNIHQLVSEALIERAKEQLRKFS